MLRTLLFTALLLAFAGVSKAGLVITPSSPSPNPIIAGSSGTIDFLIRASAGTQQTLDGFAVRIAISGGTTGGLVFSTQTDSQLGDPNYVFSGNSFSQNSGSFVGAPLLLLDPTGQTYGGSDFTDNFVPVTLNDTDDKLLLRLNLTGVAAGNYTLTINPIDPDPNLTVTSFYTSQSNPVGTTIPGANVTLNSGQVQVIVTAVPEPGTISLVGVGLAGLTFIRRKRPIS